jgi:small-conductance mechanosensitive channel
MNHRFCMLLVAMVSWSAVAHAQIPIPDLVKKHSPEVRLASEDLLVDEVSVLIERIESQRKTANADLEQARRIPIAQSEPDGTFAASSDAANKRDLIDALERELERSESALRIANKALLQAKKPFEPASAVVRLEELVKEAMSARRLERRVRLAESVREQFSSLLFASSADEGSDESLAGKLEAMERRLAAAESVLADARALDSRVALRTQLLVLAAMKQHLEVSSTEIQGAKVAATALARDQEAREEAIRQNRRRLRRDLARAPNVEQRTDRALQTKLLQASRALTLSKLGQLELKQRALEAQNSRSRVLLLAKHVLLRDGSIQQLEEQEVNVLAVKANNEQDRASIEAALASLREQMGVSDNKALTSLLAERRSVLETWLEELDEHALMLEEIEVTAELTREVLDRRQRFSMPVGSLLTLLILAASALLLSLSRRFRRHLQNLVVRIPSARLKRILAPLSAILWPLSVCGSAIVLIAGPIWNLDFDLRSALSVFSHPLLYLGEDRISALSVINLIVVIILTVFVSHGVRSVLSRQVYPRFGWDVGLTNALSALTHYTILFVGLLVGLHFVGISLSSLMLFLGIVGIGLGFGLRNVAENFISGLIILAERTVKAGDFVDIDGKVEGQVEAIRARSTIVVTRDNISLIIPNSELVGSRVTNWSHSDPKVRVGIPIGVVYGSDTDMVRKVLLDVAGRHGRVLKKPAPDVQFRAFGTSSLEFVLLIWIEEQYHRFRIASDLHFAIDKAFRKFRIEVAFPQMVLHLKSISPEVLDKLARSGQTGLASGLAIRPTAEDGIQNPSAVPSEVDTERPATEESLSD